ncbi:HAMP domain-containing histidine kinase [Maribrevibacterium harenarium]|uniref:histidine kinase n=1 Tax=Maribrevibacterium harenarium TaxID=2589817 RepID=A0A501WPK8_9GAMM|nr:ATP-binding protein [Maribrevibacterium harenarium]TPE50280.1 HAMP domain-containing histidine kinase [Maribrevibacterium harenarium]
MVNPALEPRHNWRLLLQLRTITIVGQAAAAFALFSLFENTPALPFIAAIIAIYALINGLLWIQLRNPELPGHRSYFMQLLLDLMQFSFLFYFAGGINNPFVYYYLVPIAIAAVVLPIRYAMVLTGTTIVSYSLLIYWHLPLPSYNDQILQVTLSQWARWINFVVCSAFICCFLNHMVTYVRQQQEWLSTNREQLLQDEQILAIATYAAGTAHELGTPITSAQLICEELLADLPPESTQSEDVKAISQQLSICSQTLRKLAQKAKLTGEWESTFINVSNYMDGIIDNWHLLRAQVTSELHVQKGNAPTIKVDPTLDQALINLLNNAADANPKQIRIDLSWTASHVNITIYDRGPGIPQRVLERLGQTVTTSKDGMGIGFFLSNASVARLGGTVALYPLELGGTMTQIVLPIHYANQV